jgi:hypothetical protein
MATETALIPRYPDLEQESQSWLARLGPALHIISSETYQQADELLTGIKGLRASIAESCDPVISATHKAHAAACRQKRDLEAPLIDAENALKKSMLNYNAEQERKRLAEQRRLEAEQRAREEEERLAEAEALEAAGEHELAEEALEAPSIAPPIVLPAAVPKVKSQIRTTWAAEVTDKARLIQGIRAGIVPLNAVDVNQSVLDASARALGAQMCWPGVRVFEKQSMATGRR